MRLVVLTQRFDLADSNLGFAHGWITRMAAECQAVRVVAAYVGNGPTPPGVEVRSLGKERGAKRPARILRFHQTLRDWVRPGAADVVFAHMCPEFAIAAWPYAATARLPLVLWYTHGAVPWRLCLAVRLVDRVFTSSPEGCRVSDPRIRITGHGIDTALFTPGVRPRDRQVPVLLSVGRLSPVKRIHVLLDALALFRRRGGRPIHVRIVGGPAGPGDEGYAAGLREQAQKLGLGEMVCFVGPVPYSEVVREYQAADIFVNLSETGSLDKAVLEAMSCGLFPLTTNVAFRSALAGLPGDPFLELATAEGMVAGLERALEATRDPHLPLRLRQIVQERHDLSRLIRLILDECETLMHAEV